MVLLVLVLAASGFAFWGLRGETSSAGNDRLARQLFDCAEQALAFGKKEFTNERLGWDQYLNTDVCSTGALPCPPFPTNSNPGQPPLNYPTGTPFTGIITVDATKNLAFIYNIGIYNNHENLKNPNAQCNTASGDTTCKYHDGDSTVILYARCTDPTTHQSRSTQVVLNVGVQSQGCPYRSMAGAGCRGDGNQN